MPEKRKPKPKLRKKKSSKTPKKQQIKLCVELIDKTLAHNAAEVRGGRPPAVGRC